MTGLVGHAMTKVEARNDGIGHPGPDPGSNSSVCTDEIAGQARNDGRVRARTMTGNASSF